MYNLSIRTADGSYFYKNPDNSMYYNDGIARAWLKVPVKTRPLKKLKKDIKKDKLNSPGQVTIKPEPQDFKKDAQYSSGLLTIKPEPEDIKVKFEKE